MHDLELIGVGKTYPDGTVAVQDFDLQVGSGEFVAFLGPSGCGKSTTLRMIAGFEEITHGRIMIKGRDVSRTPPEKRPTSMIFQNYALFPHMNVRDNIGFGLDVKGLSKREKDTKVDRILDMFGLTEFADRPADRLSGGQRQRIALARGLVVEPEILLLDEPLGALDANLRRIIQNELKLLQRELGITFVFVTHAQSEALGLSDRVVVMSDGVVEQISTPTELYRRPASAFVADFIGANAIFEGRGLRRDGASALLDTALGEIRAPWRDGIDPAQGLLAVVPAEAMRIDAADAVPVAGRTRLSGALSGQQVVGATGHFKVRLTDGREVVVEGRDDALAGRALATGDPVSLSFAQESVTLVPPR
ncbi:ABC transporter ATP-binding protein [uncultured Limimaricola sp.]|uniref:ABC transporter ATP-binding protein n=1 Tax=uncultured Limimaricola sp. TaxID=2211667 RepID=UPI0030FB4819